MNGFTIYKEYFDLITLLQKKEQSELLLAICNYMFFDEEPILNESQMKIFRNLKRPLDKSKKRSVSGSTINTNSNQNEIKTESKQNQNKNKKETHQDVNVIVDFNNLEKIEYEEEKPFKKIIDYLNKRTNSKFKYNAKSTQQKINARLNERYSLDDFIVVIDKKTAEWKNTEFEKYLCPETLFGPKFEKYLNQKNKKKEPIPDWFDNEVIDSRELTEEERIEMSELINAISK